MTTLYLIIVIHSVIFTLCFGAAAILPLIKGHADSKPKNKVDDTSSYELIGDILLILLDCMPVFWLFRAVPEVPGIYMTAHKRWNERKSIRMFFYLSLFFLGLSVITGTII